MGLWAKIKSAFSRKKPAPAPRPVPTSGWISPVLEIQIRSELRAFDKQKGERPEEEPSFWMRPQD